MTKRLCVLGLVDQINQLLSYHDWNIRMFVSTLQLGESDEASKQQRIRVETQKKRTNEIVRIARDILHLPEREIGILDCHLYLPLHVRLNHRLGPYEVQADLELHEDYSGWTSPVRFTVPSRLGLYAPEGVYARYLQSLAR